MSLWDKAAAQATGPRVALAAMIGVLSTLLLIFLAEAPMGAALKIAVALDDVSAEGCAPGDLAPLRERPSNFDGRSFGVSLERGFTAPGYTAEEAQAILCAMEAQGGAGKRAYLERHFPLDMWFPVAYGVSTAMLWLWLLPRFGWLGGPARFLALTPLIAAMLDVFENLAVRELVLAGPGVDDGAVAAASALTTAKYLFVTIGLYPAYLLLAARLLIDSRRVA